MIDAAGAARAAGLLVFDPSGVTGHHDHAAASAAALLAAADMNLPVLGWTLPDSVATQLNRECGTGFVGHPPVAIDIELPVTRTRQVAACAAHVSQAIPTSVLLRRLNCSVTSNTCDGCAAQTQEQDRKIANLDTHTGRNGEPPPCLAHPDA